MIITKSFNLLPKIYKRNCLIFLIMLIIATLLETIGIGIIFPLLDIIINKQFSKNLLGIDFINFSQNYSYDNIINFLIFFIFILYFIKSVYLIYFAYWQNKFHQNIFKTISTNLFEIYLNQDMRFYFSRNSSELLRNALQEAKSFGQLAFFYLRLAAEIILVFSIALFMFYVDPVKAIIASIFLSLLVFIFYTVTKKRIYNYGLIRQSSSGQQIKILQESFGAIKDIKLKSTEPFFKNLYDQVTNKFTRAAYAQSTILELPKILIELVLIFLVCIFFLSMSLLNKDFQQVLPLIGLYAAAAFKLMPSITKVIANFQNIKNLQSTAEKMIEEFNNINLNLRKNTARSESLILKDKIKLSNLSFSYNNEKSVINNLNLEIKKNSFTGIIGKSGTGKSTVVDLIMGIIEPTSGNIFVDDQNIRENIKGWQKNIGYVSQSIFLLDESIKSNIAFGVRAGDIDNERLNQALADAQLVEFIKYLPEGIDTVVGEKGINLSGGQIQRIGIARELYRRPSIFILDEATSGLDIGTEDEFLASLENLRNKLTVIIVSHRKNTLKNCDKIIDIN